jgi:predicted nucleotidyltransferase
MKALQYTNPLPSWLDDETSALVEDMIKVLATQRSDLIAVILYGSVARHEERSLEEPDPSDVDILVILDTDDPHTVLYQGGPLSHLLGQAYNRHLDAPREVQVMFSTRTMQEWDPTFIEHVRRDGIVLFARGALPAPLAV